MFCNRNFFLEICKVSVALWLCHESFSESMALHSTIIGYSATSTGCLKNRQFSMYWTRNYTLLHWTRQDLLNQLSWNMGHVLKISWLTASTGHSSSNFMPQTDWLPIQKPIRMGQQTWPYMTLKWLEKLLHVSSIFSVLFPAGSGLAFPFRNVPRSTKAPNMKRPLIEQGAAPKSSISLGYICRL